MAALLVLCMAQFMVVLDVTIVVVALPDAQRGLEASQANLQWVVTGYTLAFGGLLVPAGRAADVYGRRRTFVAGLLLFGLGSLACGLAPSLAALVAVRAVQGAGAALVAPAALALLTAAYGDGPARRRAIGWWTAAAAGGGASGWLLGGALTGALGWRAVFLVNVPVALAGAVLAPRLLAESRDTSGGRRLDAGGALALTAGLALLVLALTRVEQRGIDAATAGCLAAAALALWAFAVAERRSPRPLLPRDVLRGRGFSAAGLAALALTAATTPAMFVAVLFQQHVLGFTATASGVACAPFNLAVIAGSAAGPRVRDARVGMGAGMALVAAGALLLATSTAGDPYAARLLPAFVLMGAGLGIASVASTASGTAALGPDRRGLASGLLNAAAQLGTVIGLAVLMTAAAARTAAAGAPGDPGALLAGYRVALVGAAAIAAVAAAATVWTARHGAERRVRPPRADGVDARCVGGR